MTAINFEQLHMFFAKASVQAYASEVKAASPEKRGLQGVEHREGSWHYKDRFCGFFKSWGQEGVWHEGRRVWVQDYGGGMEAQHMGDAGFTKRTITFLKRALAAGKTGQGFYPRGPKSFTFRDWRYETDVQGSMKKFDGVERIFYKDNLVFTQRYFGGVVLDREVTHVGA